MKTKTREKYVLQIAVRAVSDAGASERVGERSVGGRGRNERIIKAIWKKKRVKGHGRIRVLRVLRTFVRVQRNSARTLNGVSTFRRYRDFGTFRATTMGRGGCVCVRVIMGLEHCRSFRSVYWRTISFRLLSRAIVIPCNARSYLITHRERHTVPVAGRRRWRRARKKRTKHAPYDRYRRRRRTAFKNARGRFASARVVSVVFGFRSPTALAWAAETCRSRIVREYRIAARHGLESTPETWLMEFRDSVKERGKGKS